MDASLSLDVTARSARYANAAASAALGRWPVRAASNRVLLIVGLPMVGFFMALTALDAGGQVVVWENAHWTTAGLLAFALATSGALRSGGIERHLRALLAASAGTWVLGQLAWNTEVYLGPFDIPSPADVGYLGAMVPAVLALVLVVRGRLSLGEELAVYLDATAIFLTISALVIAFAEPMEASSALMRAIVLAYPILHLATAAAGLVALLAVRAEPAPRGAYLVLAGTTLLGVAWIAWLHAAIVAVPPAGSGFNYLFSFGIVALGAGGATWSARRDAGDRYQRFAETALWLLPVAALATSVLIILARRIGGAAFDVSDVAAAGVVVVAGLRQTLLVRERDQLLIRERESHDELDRALVARSEAQALYQALVENVPAVVYLDQEDPSVSDGGRLAYMSPRIRGLLGYEPSAFIDDPELFPSLIHPHDRDAALHAVSAAVLAVTRHLSVHEVFQVIVRAAARLLDARYAALGIPDDQGSFAEFVVEGISDELARAIGPLPRQHGLLGAMLRDGKPERLADVRRDPRFEYWPRAHPVLTDFLGVPITDGDEVLGIVFLANKRQPGGFTERDQELLTLFATHAAIALTNARLYERNRELTVIAERSRLARELHDAVAQKLFSLRLTAQAAAALATRDPGRVPGELAQVERLAADALAELRSVIFELRPVDLAEDGLAASLRKHVEMLNRVYDARLTFRGDGDVGLSEERELTMFRIAQEAVHNALRHADADDVELRLRRDGMRVILTIADDGAGFDVADAGRDGLGLSSMRDRAEAVGAALTIESAPGSGTVIKVEVPG
jgi:signal transduction histidine kinase